LTPRTIGEPRVGAVHCGGLMDAETHIYVDADDWIAERVKRGDMEALELAVRETQRPRKTMPIQIPRSS
jgi:hypothetical protein